MVTVKRVQTGLRIERSMLKVLKGLAEYLDLSLGELIEGIVLHAFDGKVIFGEPTKEVIEQLSTVYGLTLCAEDSHRLSERKAQDSAVTADLSGPRVGSRSPKRA